MSRIVKYLAIVLKWRRLIIINTLAFTLVGVVVSLVLPRKYTATAQLLPPSDETNMLGLSGLLGSGVTSQLGRFRPGALGGPTPSDLMVGILSSRTVMQNVAERCSIRRYYRIKRNSTEGAVRTLKEMTALKASDEGIVRISATAKTRDLAAAVANAYVAELDTFLRHSNVSRGRNMRVFIERRLADVRKSLAEARDSLRAFQQQNNVTSVDDETKAAIDEYAKMQSLISAKQATLAAAQEVSGNDNPYVTSLTHEIAALRAQRRHLEEGSAERGFGVGFGVSFQRLPSVAAEFARRYQDYRIQAEGYAALYEQYEYARILEARDVPALTVVDYAIPPELHSFPRRGRIVAVVFLFSLVVGIALAFSDEYFAHLRVVRPEEYEGWRNLLDQLKTVARRVGRLFIRK